jgi:uncharacterized protein (DUF924 family)
VAPAEEVACSSGVSMEFSEVLDFWFPASSSRESDRLSVQIEWWYRGGADAAVRRRFVELNEWALAGQLDRWKRTPRGRLALIIVLDQFTRAIRTSSAAASRAGLPLASRPASGGGARCGCCRSAAGCGATTR